jgi:macrodomain Ter protein organizer (MatP/YcbG family)
MTVEVNDEVVEWFEKKAAGLGLDIDDLVEFLMKGYLSKNDPKKAVEMNNRNRLAAGMSVEKAKKYVSLPVDKVLWEELCTIAKKKDTEPSQMVLSMIDEFARNEE